MRKKSRVDYVGSELQGLVIETGESRPRRRRGSSASMQRAAIHVQSSGREEVTGANVLIAIFAERESHAAYFLQEQDMTRYDAVNYISHGIAKRPGMSDSSKTARAAPTRRSPNAASAANATPKTPPIPRRRTGALDAYCVNLNKKAQATGASIR